jgi:prepilin-type N-terminal cleavage/methylation domain-containing protein
MNMSLPPVAKYRGFTLSELLVTLGIVGLISIWAIPKILISTKDHQKIAVFKETLGAMNNVVYTGVIKEELRSANFFTYLTSHLNYKVACPAPNDARCWPEGQVNGDAGSNVGGAMIFTNGARINSIDPDSGPTAHVDGLYLDWNAEKGPNLPCEDQLPLIICFGRNADGSNYFTLVFVNAMTGEVMRPGEIAISNWLEGTTPACKALWERIYQ